MIILRVRDRVVVFLDNPKCASTTFREFVYPQLRRRWRVVFESNKGINQVDRKYKSPKYRHCPLSAAVKVLRRKGLDPRRAAFIATLREPVSRVVATFHWDLPKRGYYGVKGDPSADLHHYFHTNPHLAKFAPQRWRTHKSFRLTDVLHLESFDADLRAVNDKYGLGLDLSKGVPRKLVNKKPKAPVTVSPALRAAIAQRYALDYEDGGYAKPPDLE